MNIIIILSLLFIAYYIYTTTDTTTDTTYISSSSVQGKGLFAKKHISKGDIIIENLFPNKPLDEVIYDPITESKFKYYMGDKTAKINHCSNIYNSKVMTMDRKIYQLVSIEDIPSGTEITVNYDLTNKAYPFISGSKEGYKKC